MMRAEVVQKRAWVTEEELLDMLSAASLLPGPTSTELALYLGHRRAGIAGLAVAGACFITPAALMVGGLAWVYVHYGDLPSTTGFLLGMKPALIAVIAQALFAFGKASLKSAPLIALSIVAAVLSFFFAVPPIGILLGAGVIAVTLRSLQRSETPPSAFALPAAAAVAVKAAPPALPKVFVAFLKIGAVAFGSGYVLLSFLQDDLVDRTHWLTQRELVDAIAVGQVTPGPFFTTATFVGYVLGRAPGAAIATFAIFLPSFVLVAASGKWIPKLRKSPYSAAFLDGVNVASLALMAVTAAQIARTSIASPFTIAIAIISALLLFSFKRLNSAWVLIAAGAIGAVLRLS